MAQPDSDKDTEEPIHFTEDFRKAKRNVLFWAIIAFLLAVAAGDVISLRTSYGEGVLPKLLLLALADMVLLFMTLSFVRAAIRLGADNSDFKNRHRLLGTSKLGEVLIREISESTLKIQTLADETEDLRTRIRENRTSFESALDDMVGSIQKKWVADAAGALQVGHEWGRENPSTVPSNEQALSTAEDNWGHSADYFLKQQETDLTSLLEVEARTLEEIEKREPILISQHNEQARKIADLSDSLQSFSKSLVTGEKRWFVAVDVLPAVVAIAAATFFSFQAFYAPSWIESTLSSWGLAAERN